MRISIYTIIMSRGILIIGNESALSGAIEIEAGRRTTQYTIALIVNRLSRNNTREDSPASTEKGRFLLDWSPGSPIAARTLVIAAENRLGQIDDAILVCDPPSIRCAAADLNMADVEVLVNDHVKSWLFVVKELAAVFRKQEKGTLSLVYPETGSSGGKDDTADLLGPVALSAFRTLTRNLLASSLGEPYCTLGFSGAEAGDEAGFAAFIFKQLEEGNRRTNGKLYKYGKLGFFGK